MRIAGAAVLLLWAAAAARAQQATPLVSSSLPKTVITGGGGLASPHGKFAYGSESSYLGAGTYATVSVEETLINGQIENCTLAGVTKVMYQFSSLTMGVTGLGGSCTSTSGAAGGAGSGQGFIDLRFGKSAWGIVATFMKNTTGGWKATLAPRWAR